MQFVNRQAEIQYLDAYLTSEPNAILFVYGPKSSGKSALLDIVVHKLDLKRYAVNFLDLRGVLLYDFQSFLNVFFPKDFKENAKDIIEGISINLGFFALKANDETLLKKNAFKVMEDKLVAARKRGILPVIILDEIQVLKTIYLNHERYLIDELLNLFVRLTKVTHTAHVVLATSESHFIEEICQNVKLKKASTFYFVDHLDEQTVRAWLAAKHFNEHDIDTVWRYLGGCPWEIQQVLIERANYQSIEEACLFWVNDEYAKIREFRNVLREEGLCEEFDRITQQIVRNGSYSRNDQEDAACMNALIKKMVAQDIWFYKTDEQKIIANSQSIYRAFEKMVNQRV